MNLNRISRTAWLTLLVPSIALAVQLIDGSNDADQLTGSADADEMNGHPIESMTFTPNKVIR